MNIYEPNIDDFDAWMHLDLCTATEHNYWSYKMGEFTKVEAAQNLISIHQEFIVDDSKEAKESAKDSWNAYANFLEDFNR